MVFLAFAAVGDGFETQQHSMRGLKFGLLSFHFAVDEDAFETLRQ